MSTGTRIILFCLVGAILIGFALWLWGDRQTNTMPSRVITERRKKCENCEHGGFRCDLCDCVIHLKTALPDQECPDIPAQWGKYKPALA